MYTGSVKIMEELRAEYTVARLVSIIVWVFALKGQCLLDSLTVFAAREKSTDIRLEANNFEGSGLG